MTVCSIENCEKMQVGRGLCRMHYSRLLRHGDPLVVKVERSHRGEPQCFYESVVLGYEGAECLIWPFGRFSNGYGKMGGRIVSRLVCEDEYGAPPTAEHEAAHSCGKGHLGCVTKKHLRWATPKENNSDKELHGTSQRGENNPYSKLTESDVITIRSLLGSKSQRQIAKDFGVSQFCIHSIKSGKKWGWFNSCAES